MRSFEKLLNKSENQTKKDTCELYLTDALAILEEKRNCINGRNKLMYTCRHQEKYLFKNWKKNI